MVREEECSSLWEEKLESISEPGDPGNAMARHTCVPVHTPVLVGTMNFVAQPRWSKIKVRFLSLSSAVSCEIHREPVVLPSEQVKYLVFKMW